MLASYTTVGRPGDYTPLVFDSGGRLYLHRSWDAERRLAEAILAGVRSYPGMVPPLQQALTGTSRPMVMSGTSRGWLPSAAVAPIYRHFRGPRNRENNYSGADPGAADRTGRG